MCVNDVHCKKSVFLFHNKSRVEMSLLVPEVDDAQSTYETFNSLAPWLMRYMLTLALASVENISPDPPYVRSRQICPASKVGLKLLTSNTDHIAHPMAND